MDTLDFPEITIKELKSVVDHIMKILHHQASKQDDAGILLQTLAGKLDIHGQRLRGLEGDIKQVKAMLSESRRSLHTKSEMNMDEVSQLITTASRSRSPQSARSPKATRSPKAARSSTSSKSSKQEFDHKTHETLIREVQTFVREGLCRLGDEYVKHADDVTSRLDKLDDTLFMSLSLTESIKTLQSSLTEHNQSLNDMTEKVKTAEHLLNEQKPTLSDVTEKVRMIENALREEKQTTMSELKSKVQTIECSLEDHRKILEVSDVNKAEEQNLNMLLERLGDTLEKQMDFMKQVMTRKDMAERFDALQKNTEQQLLALEKIQGEYGPKSILNKVLVKHNQTLLDQIISESQITREVVQMTKIAKSSVQMTKTPRTSYVCDFYVTNFNESIGSEDDQFSQIWYMDGIEASPHLKGHVMFENEKTLDIGIVHARYPRIAGLQIEKGASKVKVNVMAVGKGPTYWELGFDEIRLQEGEINDECDGWLLTNGWSIAKIPCQEFKEKNFIDQHDRVLLRYEIIVL